MGVDQAVTGFALNGVDGELRLCGPQQADVVVVVAWAGGMCGLGYTYGHAAVAEVVSSTLASEVEGNDAFSVGTSWHTMVRAVRNIGWPGVAASAISGVDVALWDLKARLLGLPLVRTLDAVHSTTPISGSGGFCPYNLDELPDQLAGWVRAGIPRVKIKVGRDPGEDERRVAAARRAKGDDVQLFVDANGAYAAKEALRWAQVYADFDVRWLEEPVSSDDLEGLRFVRQRVPAGMEVAAGEYG